MGKRHSFRNVSIGVIITVIAAVFLYFGISVYNDSHPRLQYTFSESPEDNLVQYPDAKFAVISDLHYYDNSLGTTGSAFEKVLKSDRKLVTDSADLINFAVDNILKTDVKFVLVSGDLTKDGEKDCHEKVSKALSRLTDKGIKVYVVPGNHDVNNPWSYKYSGDKEIPVSNITAAQFADIYKNFGYKDAIYRDSSTLSYVAEPVDNLWVVALDTCRYKENKPGHEEIVSGKLSQDQEKWLCNILKKANEKKKAVIVLEHHGLVEHWTGQSKLHPEYLIQDYKYVGKLLASYGVRLAFTGHYHAQDITLGDFQNDGFLYDIETGSLITAPCPVRYCNISNNKIAIKSVFLVDRIHPSTDFSKKAEQFVSDTVKGEAYKTLRKYLVPKNDADKIAEYVGAAFVAHYRGDEDINNNPDFDESKLGFWSKIVYSREKYVIDGLWKDLPPGDNNVTLDLSQK